MKKKLMFLSSIFGLIFIANHTPVIENLFSLDYPIGFCIPSYLLFIIAAILLIRKK